MVSLNVILGAAGVAGFTFGLVRMRVADNRSNSDPTDPADAGELPSGDRAEDL